MLLTGGSNSRSSSAEARAYDYTPAGRGSKSPMQWAEGKSTDALSCDALAGWSQRYHEEFLQVVFNPEGTMPRLFAVNLFRLTRHAMA